MKTKVLNTIAGISLLMGYSTSFAGGGQIGSAGISQHLVGRLVESTCNRPTGIAEIKAAVINPETNEMNYVALNLVNNQLCIKDSMGPQPITDMALNSFLGASADGGERLRLHEITVNENNIATDIKEVVVDGKLAATYNRFNLLDFNSYPRVDKRLFHSDQLTFDPQQQFDNRTPDLAAQVRQLAE